jgi:hypothetical protein
MVTVTALRIVPPTSNRKLHCNRYEPASAAETNSPYCCWRGAPRRGGSSTRRPARRAGRPAPTTERSHMRPREAFLPRPEMPSRSPVGNIAKEKKIPGRTEATHPDGSPPRGPDRDLVGAVPVLGHLEPRPLLGAMPHAHQPGRGGTPPAASRESRPTTHCLPGARNASEVERHTSARSGHAQSYNHLPT